MARYRRGDIGERRTDFLGMTLTPSEKAELARRAKATGRSLSDFARIVLMSDLKCPAPSARDPAALRELSYQLSKVGTNLNQLAKIANERRSLPRETEFREIAARIEHILLRVTEL